MQKSASAPADPQTIVSEAAVHACPGAIRRLLVPSIPDVLFIVLVAILFMSGSGWSQLLLDGQTGTHIRTGDLILARRSVPTTDPFLFSVPQSPWYAWEWLADVTFAAIHHLAGLKGVVLFSGSIICLALTLLFRHMIWRGVGIPVAVAMTILAADALRFHYLARPLVFTTLLVVVAFWILDRDWSHASRAAWTLVPLTAVWTNLHGGFVVLIAALACFAVAAAILRDRQRLSRYTTLAACCSAATLINPYGWQLHVHIWSYLRSDWLIAHVNEFQSPVFRGEGMMKVELLLILGLVCVAELVRSRRYQDALLIVFWAHAALTSVRHVTIFVITAAPAIAAQASNLWERWANSRSRLSVIGTIQGITRDLRPAATGMSIWAPALLAVLTFSPAGNWPTDFPPTFPTAVLARNASLFQGPERRDVRVFNVDKWGGYLTYKFYPNRCAFVDGRSDYFGPKIIDEYLAVRSSGSRWDELTARYGFQFALIPPNWALAEALKKSDKWVLRDQDKTALLFEVRGR